MTQKIEISPAENKEHLKKPAWLKTQLTDTKAYASIKHKLSACSANTICESGKCPNKAECWNAGTATIMILGNICTRACLFCAVDKSIPNEPDTKEPYNTALLVKEMGIKHCVLTSVTRDDLPLGGAALWAETIKQIKMLCPTVTIEALIPDFNGEEPAIRLLAEQKPEIISHNLETVERLTPIIRKIANYKRSLSVLASINKLGVKSKTGIMVGLGETDDEVLKTMDDILETGCRIITIGQYLRPRLQNIAVDRYVSPDTFQLYREEALKRGFIHADAAPLVRSSYHSAQHIV